MLSCVNPSCAPFGARPGEPEMAEVITIPVVGVRDAGGEQIKTRAAVVGTTGPSLIPGGDPEHPARVYIRPIPACQRGLPGIRAVVGSSVILIPNGMVPFTTKTFIFDPVLLLSSSYSVWY